MRLLFFISLALILVFGCKKKDSEVKPSIKAITKFGFLKADNNNLSQDVIGTVTSDSVLLYVSPGTNVSNLAPTISFKGASISPQQKVSEDFSHTQFYTVTAEDGSVRSYKAVVFFHTGTKEITSFVFKKTDNPSLDEDLAGVIRGDSIVVNTPPGIDVGSLNPTVVHTGVSVSPESGISKDFSYPLSYTVTADDNSTRKYKVYVSANRNVFISGSDHWLYAINAMNGEVQWKYNTGSIGVPVYHNSVVFVAGTDNSVYAINAADGSLKWKSTPPPGNYGLNLPVVKYGKLYFGGSGYLTFPDGYAYYHGFVYCLNEETGIQEWLSKLFTSYTYSDSRITNVTVADNIACVYDMMNGIFAFNASDGSPAWGKPGDMLGRTNPAIDNGVVYYGIEGGLRAVSSSDGHELWKLIDNRVYTSATISNGALYASVSNGVASFNLDGSARWESSYGVNGNVIYAPLAYNNTVYACNDSKRLIAFSAQDGSLKWTKDYFNAYIVSSNKEIFIIDAGNHLTCSDAATGNTKWSNQNLAIFSTPFCVVDSKENVSHVVDSGGQN